MGHGRWATAGLLAALCSGCTLKDYVFVPVDATVTDAADESTSDAGSLAAPRPIAPVSTSTVTSATPTLRWELPAGATGARVELCSYRACTHVLQTVMATGRSVRPSMALAPGVVFWRLTSTDAGGVVGAPGVTWEFRVGHRSAMVDSSYGTTLDVNGDGYGDLAVGAPGALGMTGRVYVFYGSATGVGAMPDAVLTGPDGTGGGFGSSVYSAGDVNGDGYGDLVVGAPGVNMGEGRAHVFLGGATGIATTGMTLNPGAGAMAGFGTSVAGVGDLIRDGYADVVVGAPTAHSGDGRVYVFSGSSMGAMMLSATLDPAGLDPPVSGGHFGAAVAGVGDMNGDGYPEVAVGVPCAFPDADAGTDACGTGQVVVYGSNSGGLMSSPLDLLGEPSGALELGAALAPAGDYNGDGYCDLAVGAPNASNRGAVYVNYGGSALSVDRPHADVSIALAMEDGDRFGQVLNAGDFDGDGFDDLVVSAPFEPETQIGCCSIMIGPGRIRVLPGASTGVSSSRVQTLDMTRGSLSGQEDLNGDGLADLAVGMVEAVSIFSGNTHGVPNAPGTNIVGPDGRGANFGASVY